MANATPPPGDGSMTWAQRFQLFWNWAQGLFTSTLPGSADAYRWLNSLYDGLP